MTDVVVWHNPRCSTSRKAIARLTERGAAVTERRYLVDRPSRVELERLLAQLGIDDPRQVMRTREVAYRERALADADQDTLLDAIVAEPVLLERPIVVRGERAVVGRPLETVDDLLAP